MGKCAVKGCKIDLRHGGWQQCYGISHHVFPRDPEKRAEWLRAIGREDWKISKPMICSLHFREEDMDRSYDRPRIKPNAVPSLALQPWQANISAIQDDDDDSMDVSDFFGENTIAAAVETFQMEPDDLVQYVERTLQMDTNEDVVTAASTSHSPIKVKSSISPIKSPLKKKLSGEDVTTWSAVPDTTVLSHVNKLKTLNKRLKKRPTKKNLTVRFKDSVSTSPSTPVSTDNVGAEPSTSEKPSERRVGGQPDLATGSPPQAPPELEGSAEPSERSLVSNVIDDRTYLSRCKGNQPSTVIFKGSKKRVLFKKHPGSKYGPQQVYGNSGNECAEPESEIEPSSKPPAKKRKRKLFNRYVMTERERELRLKIQSHKELCKETKKKIDSLLNNATFHLSLGKPSGVADTSADILHSLEETALGIEDENGEDEEDKESGKDVTDGSVGETSPDKAAPAGGPPTDPPPSNAQQPDEFQLFGQHIAAQLKSLPLRSARMLQAKFQFLITAESLAELSKTEGEKPLPQTKGPKSLTTTQNTKSPAETESLQTDNNVPEAKENISKPPSNTDCSRTPRKPQTKSVINSSPCDSTSDGKVVKVPCGYVQLEPEDRR